MFFRDLLSWLKPSYYLITSFILFVSLVARAITYRCIIWCPLSDDCLVFFCLRFKTQSVNLCGRLVQNFIYIELLKCVKIQNFLFIHTCFFHSRILLNWKTMILERFSDLTWGPAHCTPLTRIVPRLLLLYSIPSIHNYRNVVIRTGSWTAAYVCFVYACCLYCCVNLPLVPFCMFASFACFDLVT